jgi:hypothetical protein
MHGAMVATSSTMRSTAHDLLAAPILMASVTINDVLYGASHRGIDRDNLNLPAWRPVAACSVTQTAARSVTVEPLRFGIEIA